MLKGRVLMKISRVRYDGYFFLEVQKFLFPRFKYTTKNYCTSTRIFELYTKCSLWRNKIQLTKTKTCVHKITLSWTMMKPLHVTHLWYLQWRYWAFFYLFFSFTWLRWEKLFQFWMNNYRLFLLRDLFVGVTLENNCQFYQQKSWDNTFWE